MARRDLNRRLDRLEQKSGSGLTIIYGQPGETQAQARQRHELRLGKEPKGVVVFLDAKDAAA